MNEFESETPSDLPSTWKFWQKRRYVVVLMAIIGFSKLSELNVDIVAMTENRIVHYDNGTVVHERYFDWSSKEQELIVSSFFYGYILTSLLGGYLGAKLGGSLVFGLGIFAASVLTLLAPIAAHAGLYTLVAVRLMQGMCQGVALPSIQDVWSRWSPPQERSRISTMSYAGTYVGTVIAVSFSRIMASNFVWESTFYVLGGIACVWCICWLIIVKRDPEQDRRISKEELKYIQSSLGLLQRSGSSTIPWKDIFTSKIVLAICVAQTAAMWGTHTVITVLPTFLRDVFMFDLGKAGLVAAAPHLTMGILLLVSGHCADHFQIKGYLTTTQVRRYFNCLGFILQAIFLLLAAFSQQSFWSVIYITLSVGFGGMAFCGFYVNVLDIAPNYASVIFGITNTLGTLPRIVSPILTEYLVKSKTAAEWRLVFYVAAGIYGIGTLVYWFWCSGELQPWAKNSTVNSTGVSKDN
ncbi:vesicular glutamate transporter 1-like [Bradysia coprophila]|uniref:vesicular glutamate transporter 1-like n=1 Tax=Bradysia coprophila TaxID=38358 RepID=UPI00187DAECB|nr:vesicular glutamate transporter 1-like [Bradysia coprophila]